jgi:hypothetical protein
MILEEIPHAEEFCLTPQPAVFLLPDPGGLCYFAFKICGSTQFLFAIAAKVWLSGTHYGFLAL